MSRQIPQFTLWTVLLIPYKRTTPKQNKQKLDRKKATAKWWSLLKQTPLSWRNKGDFFFFFLWEHISCSCLLQASEMSEPCRYPHSTSEVSSPRAAPPSLSDARQRGVLQPSSPKVSFLFTLTSTQLSDGAKGDTKCCGMDASGCPAAIGHNFPSLSYREDHFIL